MGVREMVYFRRLLKKIAQKKSQVARQHVWYKRIFELQNEEDGKKVNSEDSEEEKIVLLDGNKSFA